MSRYEPLEGVVNTVRRDLPTTRRGAVEFFLARYLPAVTDRIVARTLAGRVRDGSFEGAELAGGLVERHARAS